MIGETDHSGGNPAIMVMGVAAAGKSTIAAALADRLRLSWMDVDDLHPASNVALRASGEPLTEEHRSPWLAAAGVVLARGREEGGIVACSALKRVYRDRLRAACPGTRFVHLDGGRAVLATRAANRHGHFMPAALLESQLAILEPLGDDEHGLVIDITAPVHAIVDTAVEGVDAA
jgi:carbohydrate kinase (thermoresistant glucokinase family)